MSGLAAWNASAIAVWLAISWGSPQIEYVMVAGGPVYPASLGAADTPPGADPAGGSEPAGGALAAGAPVPVDVPPHAERTIANPASRAAVRRGTGIVASMGGVLLS